MVGQVIGKYKVVDRIGRGGMGTVYRATDETLHRDVAIKVLNAELNDPEVAKRFRAEAITVARLSHPGIATIYELFEHQNEWLMVMEFVRGETLENMATRMGPLSAQRASELCMQALAALAHAHSMGVVHRDLKPANLMITENGSVKVMDFGIARVSGSEHLTNAGFMMGTPAYMAPEQVRGGEVDARADLYAMGVVFYRLTTGRLPFKGDSAFAMVQSQVNEHHTPIATVRTDLPPWVEQIVERALAKPVEQRFQSAAEFHEALARCLAGIPLSSMYAPPDQATVMTPSRPMPSGAYSSRSMPTPSASYPMPSGWNQAPPPSGPSGAIAAASDLTVASPSGANAVPPAVPPPPAAEANAAAKPGGAPKSAAPRKSMPVALVGIIGAVIVVGVIVAMMMGGGSPPPPSASPSPVASSVPPADPSLDQTGAGAAQTATTATGVQPTPSVSPSAATGAGATVTPPPAGAPAATPGSTVARGGQPTPTPGRGATATPTATPGPPAKPELDPPATFSDIKLFEIDGKRAVEKNAIMNFGGGQLTLAPRTGGAAMAALTYKRITRATYTRGKDPKWDASLSSPPADVDFSSRIGSIIGRNYHWLVLQGADHFEILRLDDNNYSRVIQVLESRTGVKVQK